MRLVLIDGSNLYESAKHLSIRIDYKRLLELLAEDNNLLRAYYFTALPDRKVENWIHKQVDWMAHNGYVVVSKPVKEFIDPIDGTTKTKGNVDVDIAVYAMVYAQLVQEVYLFSGDGDYTILVKNLQERYALKVYVVSSMKLISWDLRKQADKFIDLNDLRKEIEKL